MENSAIIQQIKDWNFREDNDNKGLFILDLENNIRWCIDYQEKISFFSTKIRANEVSNEDVLMGESIFNTLEELKVFINGLWLKHTNK